jgi:Domain of unknown function (DUF397)
MIMIMDPRPPWRKSSYSNGQANCVEVACQPGGVAVRDSKEPQGPVLAFAPIVWQAFTRRVRTAASGPV